MEQNKESILSNENQQVTKKVWRKPELEIIAHNSIESGSIFVGPEGETTSSGDFKYHS